MNRNFDLLLTAIAPAIWGSTYLVTTQLLPVGYPLTVAMLRALPAGLLLLLIVRRLPHGVWWLKSLVLGALNFSIFWWLLFISAYRLPGGVAATVGAVQPLIVIVLARLLLGSPIRSLSIVAAIAGIGGVGLLILTPNATLDPIGIVAGIGGAFSMAAGTVLSRRWRPDVSPLTFTAWQLTAGGVLLLPVALLLEPPLPHLTGANILGFAYLGLIGAALTYILWFQGLSRLEPSMVSPLGFLSPTTAVILGWAVLGQQLSPMQIFGIVTVLASVWLSQRAQLGPAAQPSSPSGRRWPALR
ncbi:MULTISPECIES: EamA family transporter [Rhizobium]|uniref:EamA family transporter n=1 Tax=Rhizobium tropici TaxID=398 RepID=A0A329YDY3_RHITR|nr:MULTISPECIES: EamA family transporter [Rhizobium]MBB3286552.1 putative blue pigment (indigoidine) exporter [Rhizobium sp. BK252]MBB3401254.1 putative blue pigment (indigoidine) exporter [Rhizobium sp. BK289]MBB3413832.1 putative blue pigment (indigoidine) exporter [Rhizobium sp. BK284]MBB3481719.1 putative blue pigment (indigoidine) exporter [Rhizobium sp. BK347]MDK4719689.1 EamA family transporter [Rhizobium sp. CNPSo 3968]